MGKFSVKNLKDHLKSLSKEELEAEVLRLYKKFPPVQEFYKMEFAPDTSEIVNAYKDRLTKEYLSSRGFGKARNSEVRKIINEFKKICVFDYDLIDLILHRVEVAVEYTNLYGDVDETFYNSAIRHYNDALTLIYKNNLLEKFEDRCKRILIETEGVGWGFHDHLCFLYNEYFNR